jgi:tetratricopeptide (TPR) repeat protein
MRFESDTLTAAVRTMGSPSTDTARLRRRAVATGAFVLFLAAFLFTIGFRETAFLLLVVAGGLAVVGAIGWIAYRARIDYRRHAGRVRRAGAGAVKSGAGVARSGADIARLGVDTARRSGQAARLGAATTARRGGQAARRAQAKVGAGARRREAVRLNGLGVESRRSGRPQEAVVQHRKALSLMRDADDRRGEAMTENSLALALVHAGDEGGALEHFERSLVILRDLDEDESEGQVLANLGVVHSRRGRRHEAVGCLSAALRKLSPQSQAYRRVEEQLRRAG